MSELQRIILGWTVIWATPPFLGTLTNLHVGGAQPSSRSSKGFLALPRVLLNESKPFCVRMDKRVWWAEPPLCTWYFAILLISVRH